MVAAKQNWKVETKALESCFIFDGGYSSEFSAAAQISRSMAVFHQEETKCYSQGSN
jgi:hypothetical protein